MKLIQTLIAITILSLTLTACSYKEPVVEYPNVFEGGSEPKISQDLKFTDPLLYNQSETTKTFLNHPVNDQTSGNTSGRSSTPVDIFNLSKTIAAPKGCTPGVDC
jgi:hypothetical protein